MQQKVEEKIDPLTRIQEEIKEVVRREEEYRQLATLSSGTPTITSPSSGQLVDFETYTVNGNGLDFETKLEQDEELLAENQNQNQIQDQGVLVTAQPAAVQTTSLLLPIDELSNTPSLASSVNSAKEESLDGQHSDDSGISASSQTTKTTSTNVVKQSQQQQQQLKLTVVTRQEQRYIGPNCYNLTPEPPQQKLITRTISTPQLSGLPQKRQFAFGGATKGVMQRFIASHGKLAPTSPLPNASSPLTLNLAANGNGIGNGLTNGQNNNQSNSNNNNNTLKLNTRTAMAFLESGGSAGGITSVTLSPAAIERDSEGRPLRRGYVPVEQKIQRELQDLKSRESELKRLRKINRQNTLKASLDKLQFSTDDEVDADDDDEDSEVEHCYGPGKLRNAQSTQELDRNGNEQEIQVHKPSGNRSLNAAAYIANGLSNGNGNGMRPAMSLAQLCDLTPEEAPSSRGLIAQWESLIKKNAEVGAVEAII
ncbi:probable serine/threonine-protein kinase cdc7 [Drosophila takahashii]|uniref:probable serine/threonine-protein kinase cdc7 n=1 Tax=Drosophila takahashii TaxID=29030 RepID=UPI001CF862CD|nr:probable serine/threonine-protein kinase cdc7 [Drosophila takahashii]